MFLFYETCGKRYCMQESLLRARENPAMKRDSFAKREITKSTASSGAFQLETDDIIIISDKPKITSSCVGMNSTGIQPEMFAYHADCFGGNFRLYIASEQSAAGGEGCGKHVTMKIIT